MKRNLHERFLDRELKDKSVPKQPQVQKGDLFVCKEPFNFIDNTRLIEQSSSDVGVMIVPTNWVMISNKTLFSGNGSFAGIFGERVMIKSNDSILICKVTTDSVDFLFDNRKYTIPKHDLLWNFTLVSRGQ